MVICITEFKAIFLKWLGLGTIFISYLMDEYLQNTIKKLIGNKIKLEDTQNASCNFLLYSTHQNYICIKYHVNVKLL